MQERGKIIESLLVFKKALDQKPEQKHTQGTRLGEDASDVTLSPDYKKIYDGQNEKFWNSPFGKFLSSKRFDKLISKLRD